MLRSLLISLGPLISQSLSAAIAIIVASFFLYYLVKDIRNRVARAFSALLFFVLVTYIGDLSVGYSDSLAAAEPWLRFQWLGISFAPAAYVHLSDAILAMTGLPSRGRRRLVVILLYVIAALFLVLVVFTDWIVRDPLWTPAPHFRPGPAFGVFFAYFVGSVALSLGFVIRARRRTLTEATRRRMTYLLLPYAAPALAVFPFLLISGRTYFSPAVFYGLLIIVNIALVIMLTFMAYPLAFFGAYLPDRLIKAQMLQFFLRGPVVAIAALGVVIWVPRASAVLGLPGDEVMPVLVVAVILSLQWAITLIRPHLERWLIYVGDQAQIRQIQELEQRLLTGTDFQQLLDMILAAACDYLRVRTAFVASLSENGPRLERALGLEDGFDMELAKAGELSNGNLNGYLPRPEDINTSGDVFAWHGFWLIPLHFQSAPDVPPRLTGLMGVAAPQETPRQEQWRVLMALATRAAEVLEDRRLQSKVFTELEGLLPEIVAVQQVRGTAQYGDLETLTSPDKGERFPVPDFSRKIKEALAHYWGGPNLTESSLMSLSVVQQALSEHGGNPQRAVRSVLQKAIERLRPEGQRSMTTADWILYNILEMRFIQGRKVRDVAMRLAMSESDLYRKQRVAIEAVAAIIADMERTGKEDQGRPSTVTQGEGQSI
jgi:hypothetical protein